MDNTEIVRAVQRTSEKVSKWYRHRKPFHEALQLELVKLAGTFGFKGRKEFRVVKSNARRTHGAIDVAWFDQDGNLQVLIELDSAAKYLSALKLAENQARLRIWVMYGTRKDRLGFLQDIDPGGDIHLVLLDKTFVRHDPE